MCAAAVAADWERTRDREQAGRATGTVPLGGGGGGQ